MASMFDITDASVTKLTKIAYGQKAKNMYNGQCAVLGLINKTYDYRGNSEQFPVPMSLQGGGSMGAPISCNRAKYETVTLTTKKIYAVGEISGKTIAEVKDNGAFVDAIQEVMRKQVELFNFMMEVNVTGDECKLGTISSVTATAPVYTCVMTDASWVTARWQLRQIVQVGSSTDQFEITAVTRSSKSVQLTRISGSTVPAASDVVYLYGGYSEYVQGLDGVTSATSGSKYGITVGDGWQSYQLDASSGTISGDLIIQLALGLWDQVGINATHILVSTLQLRKLMSALEDLKRYNMQNVKLAPRAKELQGVIGFDGVSFVGPTGTLNIIASRMIKDSVAIAVNFDECKIIHSKQGWLDINNKSIFARKQGTDNYESLYGGYLEDYFPLTVNARLYNLSTAA